MPHPADPRREKSAAQQIADLEHDIRHLYFLLGALTDAIAQLPELQQKQIIDALQAKAAHGPEDMRDTLHTLIESMDLRE